MRSFYSGRRNSRFHESSLITIFLILGNSGVFKRLIGVTFFWFVDGLKTEIAFEADEEELDGRNQALKIILRFFWTLFNLEWVLLVICVCRVL